MTNANGAKTVKTLAQLGIPEIDLTDDATRIVAQDGSVIEGQTTYRKSDGSTGTVARTSLVAEADGHRVTEVITMDGSGNRRLQRAGWRSTKAGWRRVGFRVGRFDGRARTGGIG
ncbi:MAG: hypothetical protein R3D56_11485 [Paracoccaceae bacterium]